MKPFKKTKLFKYPLLVLALVLFGGRAYGAIDGVAGNSFNLTAKAGYISTADGNSIYTWGYANGNGAMQYPGVTMLVDQGETVTVNLTNELTVPVSIMFPGQENVTASPNAAQGTLTKEVPPGQTVTYSFIAANPGTYLYHSGTRPELQVEMGLVGALIVRPYGYSDNDHHGRRAYSHHGSMYDHEFLFLISEMDARVHQVVEFQGIAALDATGYLSNYSPNYWFINGRTAPDTMGPAFAPNLPTQPYNCMPMMHPGEKLLMRVMNAGRVMHPFHHHGNHANIIAKDGRLLESVPGAGPDLAQPVFTIHSVPGETHDAIFEWTGKDLGWDMYGTGPEFAHSCVDGDGDTYDDLTKEYCPDHGKPVPVALPQNREVVLGGFYSGSPFLGTLSQLPPGEGGMNPNGGFTYMWHSHSEKEMTNFNLFPGGMMTMIIIEGPSVPLH